MIVELYTDSQLPEVNKRVADWVSGHIWGEPERIDRHCSFGVYDGNALIAGIILHNWDPDAGTIEITAAGHGRWQSRRVINHVFNMAFDVLGCQCLIMRGDAGNSNMVSNSRRLGFTEYRIPRLCGRDRDMVIFTLTDDQWRASRLYRRS